MAGEHSFGITSLLKVTDLGTVVFFILEKTSLRESTLRLVTKNMHTVDQYFKCVI